MTRVAEDIVILPVEFNCELFLSVFNAKQKEIQAVEADFALKMEIYMYFLILHAVASS